MRLGFLIFLLSLCSCKEPSKTTVKSEEQKKVGKELNGLNWMLGKWKREDTGELALWSKKEDTFFGGMMVTLNEEEKAVIQEVLSLEGRKDGIYFSSKERGQTNRRKAEYKMSNKDFDAPKFTNQNTDYPTHISYMRIGKNKIKVEEMGQSGQGNSYYFIREM